MLKGRQYLLISEGEGMRRCRQAGRQADGLLLLLEAWTRQYINTHSFVGYVTKFWWSCLTIDILWAGVQSR